MSDEQYRGLLTETEREILNGDKDVSDSYYYRVVSRVRSKIEELDEDAELLEQVHEDLSNELKEAVCDEE